MITVGPFYGVCMVTVRVLGAQVRVLVGAPHIRSVGYGCIKQL